MFPSFFLLIFLFWNFIVHCFHFRFCFIFFLFLEYATANRLLYYNTRNLDGICAQEMLQGIIVRIIWRSHVLLSMIPLMHEHLITHSTRHDISSTFDWFVLLAETYEKTWRVWLGLSSVASVSLFEFMYFQRRRGLYCFSSHLLPAPLLYPYFLLWHLHWTSCLVGTFSDVVRCLGINIFL